MNDYDDRTEKIEIELFSFLVLTERKEMTGLKGLINRGLLGPDPHELRFLNIFLFDFEKYFVEKCPNSKR